MEEKNLEQFEYEFEKAFRKFLIELRRLRGEYLPYLGQDVIESAISVVGQKLEKEFKK